MCVSECLCVYVCILDKVLIHLLVQNDFVARFYSRVEPFEKKPTIYIIISDSFVEIVFNSYQNVMTFSELPPIIVKRL